MTPETPVTAERWVQIAIDATRNTADELADALLRAGALSVTFEDAADNPIIEPAPGETPLWDHTVVVALCDAGTDPQPVLERAQRMLGWPHALRARVSELHQCDWERAWREHFQPMQFGERLWVCPSDQRVENSEAAVVTLDPGLGFGTGTHPTTALCLQWLADHLAAGERVIDFGCGSGILAIAAAKLGAAHVWAVDIDPQARRAAADNASLNKVAHIVSVMPPDELPAITVDCVVANILARPLIALMPIFASRLRRGGRLVVSGLLADQESALLAALAAEFALTGVEEREGWLRLEAARR